jgi:hypothetical protein
MFRLMALCLLLSGLWPHPAQAREGTRVFLFVCENNGSVTMEPFIAWEGATFYNGYKMSDPRLAPKQQYGNASFYNFDSLYNRGAYKMECKSPARRVQVVLQKNRLSIVETLQGYKKSFTINIVEQVSYPQHSPR